MVFHWNISKDKKGKNKRERVYSHDQKLYQVEEVHVCVCWGWGGVGWGGDGEQYLTCNLSATFFNVL